MLKNVQRLCGMVGVSFEGLEGKVVKLFRELEKKRKSKEREVRGKAKGNRRQGAEGPRELRRLVITVNYDGS